MRKIVLSSTLTLLVLLLATANIALAVEGSLVKDAWDAGKTVGKYAGPVGPAFEVYSGYDDASTGKDNVHIHAAKGAATAGLVVGGSVAAATAAGAGSLAGYAGIASAVSTLGLGGATTAIAGAMGSTATGAAATALVTAAVGGPVVMGAILVGTGAAVSYGIYKLGQGLYSLYSDD